VPPCRGEGAEYLLRKLPLNGAGATTVQAEDWIVEEVVIEKGATLWGLARTYLGKGHYYPHLLAYNDIEFPSRIYEGKTLLVPKSRVRNYADRNSLEGRTWSVSFSGLALESLAKAPEKKSAVRSAPAKAPATRGAVKREVQREVVATEQREFDEAKSRFEAGDYAESTRLFEVFVRKYPHSKLKAEALFYSAEALMKSSEAH